MANYSVKVTADTKAAAKSLSGLDKQIDKVTKTRQLSLNLPNYKQFKSQIDGIQDAAEGAANNVKLFYQVARNAPIAGDKLRVIEDGIEAIGTTAAKTSKVISENNSTTKVMGNVTTATTRKVGDMLGSLAKLTIVLYGVREATTMVTAAFGGMFKETVGRAAKFQETLLKTKTTLASTNRVFLDGVQVTDPLEKINALSGEIDERVESIRQRSIDLAGVTSNDVVEVFGMVASQISQINGDLKQAEDLAIQFSAALGTFGIPLYQARQEIGSILRGDVTVDSYLAKALGITNEEIQKAKTETDGVVGYLNDKLAAAVAGQAIAAKGLAGVLSNIRDIYELIAQAIGEPLLDPIVTAVNSIYQILFKSKDLLTDIGERLGGILSRAAGAVGGAFIMGGEEIGQIDALNDRIDQLKKKIKELAEYQKKEFGRDVGITKKYEEELKKLEAQKDKFNPLANLAENPIGSALTAGTTGFIATFKKDVEGLTNLIEETLTRSGRAIRDLFTSLMALSKTALEAIRNLVEALIKLNLVKFESLASAFATIAQGITPILQGLTQLINLWATILEIPVVQWLAQIAITFAVLKATGVIALTAVITQLVIWGTNLKLIRKRIGDVLRTVQRSFKGVARLLSSIVRLLAIATRKLREFLDQRGGSRRTLAELKKVEIQLQKVANKAKGAEFNFRTLGAASKTLGRTLVSTALNFVKANIAIIASTILITILVDAWGRYTRALEESKIAARDTLLFTEYAKNADKLAASLTDAERAQMKFAERIAGSRIQKYTSQIDEAREALAKYKQEVDRLEKKKASREEMGLGTRTIANSIKYQLKRINEEEKKIARDKIALAKAEAVVRRKEAKKELTTLANERKGIEKQIMEVRRQFEGDLFRQRQQEARKLVEIYKKEQDIALRQIEIRNKKLIEGEEDAVKTALAAYARYLATKKRGEVDIEVARRNLQIEIANMERRALEYRWSVEKKIADLRKRTQQNEVATEKAKFEAATGQTAGGNATFGLTGNTQNAAGWVHGHFQTNTGTQMDLINDMKPVLRGLAQKGVQMELANGEQIQAELVLGPNGERYMETMINRAMALHNHSGDGRSADIFVKEGTQVPVPLTDVNNGGGRGGVMGTLPGSGKTWVGHLTPDSKAGSPYVAPDLKPVDNIPDPKEQADAFEQSTKNVAALSSQLIELSATMNALNDEENLRTFLDQALPLPKLQEVERELKAVEEAAKTVAQQGFGLTAMQANENARQKEIQQIKERNQAIRDGIAEIGGSPEDQARAQQILNDREQKQLDLTNQRFDTLGKIAAIRDRERLQLQLINTEEQLTNELADLQLATRMQLEGFQQLDIQIALRKLRLERQYQKLIEASPENAEELNKALQKQLALIDDIGKAQKEQANPLRQLMTQYKRDLADVNGYLAQMVSTITTELSRAMSAAIIGVIDGTKTIEEAMADMFKNIGAAFINMATEMIAKAIMMRVLGIFLPGAGGGGGTGGGTVFGGMNYGMGGAGIFGQAATPFAEGGFVNSATLGLIGEAGSEYVIPENKMESSMARWSMGARGKEVVEGAASLGSDNRSMSQPSVLGNASKQYSPGNNYSSSNNFNMGDGGSADNFSINITGEQLVFNERNYISQDEVPSIISQASKQGEARTLRKLRMSQNARTKVGF